MTRTELLIMLKTYVSEVNRATILRKPVSQTTRDRLTKIGAAVIDAAEQWTPSMRAARQVKAEKAAKRRYEEPFTFTWQTSGKVETILGWHEVAMRLGIAISTLRVMMSSGRGTIYRDILDDHGNIDAVQIKRANWRPRR